MLHWIRESGLLREMTSGEAAVFFAIALRVYWGEPRAGCATVSDQQLSEDTGFSERHIRRLIGKLADLGAISIVERGCGRGRASVYRPLHEHPDSDALPASRNVLQDEKADSHVHLSSVRTRTPVSRKADILVQNGGQCRPQTRTGVTSLKKKRSSTTQQNGAPREIAQRLGIRAPLGEATDDEILALWLEHHHEEDPAAIVVSRLRNGSSADRRRIEAKALATAINKGEVLTVKLDGQTHRVERLQAKWNSSGIKLRDGGSVVLRIGAESIPGLQYG